MAAADDANEQAEPTPPPRRRWPMILLLMVLVLGIGGGGGAWYLLEPQERPERAPAAHYLALDPELIVNFRDGGRVRYLQAGLELMAYEQRALDAATTHMPVLRHELLVMLSDQDYETLASGEGKERLRHEARELVRATLEERADSHAIEDVFFTSFVMQ